jgi:YtkA-like
MRSVKCTVLLFSLVALAFGQEPQHGNFDIRAEPTAKLQTGAPIPFAITVRDALHKPVVEAKVTVRIENGNPSDTRTYKAPATDPGSYVAKPEFPVAGQWNIVVDVRRANEMGTRTIEFNVPE